MKRYDKVFKEEAVRLSDEIGPNRGSQFTSHAFREHLANQNAIQSMSGTGRCYDIARMESFWATLKKRFFVHIFYHWTNKNRAVRQSVFSDFLDSPLYKWVYAKLLTDPGFGPQSTEGNGHPPCLLQKQTRKNGWEENRYVFLPNHFIF